MVEAGQTATFTAGNAWPAPISGVVYIDTNGNGIRDAGEVGRAGVRLDLAARVLAAPPSRGRTRDRE